MATTSYTFVGTNGSALPSPFVFTAGGTGGSGNIQSNRARLTTGTTSFNSADCSAHTAPTLVDQDVLFGPVSFPNPKVTQYHVFGWRVTNDGWGGGSYPNSGYFIEVTLNSNSVQLRSGVSGTYTLVGSAVAKTFTAGTDYWVRCRAVGSSIQWKIWNNGSSEPGTWDQTVTNTAVTGAGTFVFSNQNGTNAAMIMNVTGVVVDDLIPTAYIGWGMAL